MSLRVQEAELTRDRPDFQVEPGGSAILEPVRYRDGAYLFKRYIDPFREQARVEELERLVAWQPAGDVDRARLRGFSAWPRHTVWAGGSFLGVLTPVAHPVFRAWQPARRIERPRTLAELMSGDRIDAADQRNAFSHLIEAVLWFHDRGVVINDLQPQNVLVDRHGGAVLLVDCDSTTGDHWGLVLDVMAPENVQVQVPDFATPNRRTDLARLAWMIINATIGMAIVGVSRENHAALTGSVSGRFADFLCTVIRTGRQSPADRHTWREMADAWRRPVQARVAVPVRPVVPPPVPRPSLPTDPLVYELRAEQLMDEARDLGDLPPDLVIDPLRVGVDGWPDPVPADTPAAPQPGRMFARLAPLVAASVTVVLILKEFPWPIW